MKAFSLNEPKSTMKGGTMQGHPVICYLTCHFDVKTYIGLEIIKKYLR